MSIMYKKTLINKIIIYLQIPKGTRKYKLIIEEIHKKKIANKHSYYSIK